MTTHHDRDALDPATQHRAARLSALLDAEFSDDAAARDSAARMRPIILAAARRTERAAQRRRLLRAAAIVVVLGGVAAVPPARAWVVEHARQLAAALGVAGGAPAPESGATDGTAAPTGGGAGADTDVRYTFDVAGSAIVVRIDAAAGAVVIRRGTGSDADDGTRASAEAADAPRTRFVVLPDGIAVSADGATAAARFIITVPPHVRQARVMIDGGSAQDVTLHAAETVVRIGGTD